MSPLLMLALGLACYREEPVDSDWAALDGQAVIGIANLDDDDENEVMDWEDLQVAGDDDLASLSLPALLEGQSLSLTLTGDAERSRVWLDDELLLDASTLQATLSGPDSGRELRVEFSDFRVLAGLELSLGHEDEDGPLAQAALSLESAPLILNHHLQQGEYEMAMEYTGFGGNSAFIRGFEDGLGDAFDGWKVASYGYDVWIQDEIEFATQTAPGLHMDLVLDSIRSQNGQYLDALPPKLAEPGVAVIGYGQGRSSSQDYFGNLEVSPPVTVDGVHYPYGRAYWGRNGTLAPHEDLRTMLESQQVQRPFELDVSWLCVGHVDEFITFLPDPDSDKGFVMWVTDTALGWDLISEMAPETELPRYGPTHGFDTIGQMVEDDELLLVNQDLQAEYIEPNIEIMKQELGLDDADIVRIPALFEANRLCGGYSLSLIPGTANMTVYPSGDTVKAFIPDPFLRTDDDDLSSDPMITIIEDLLPSGVEAHWLDDWSTYHAAWGEVHCGSNTRRTPGGSWWEDARHLMGD